MKCRFCNEELTYEVLDLCTAPLSNGNLTKEELDKPETYYPLKVLLCENCGLVQLSEVRSSEEIFQKDYKYFSSYSSTWLKHSKDYTDMIIDKLNLNDKSFVMEIASNDGYLLQYFKEKNIPCLGIEPTLSTAQVSLDKGIPTIIDFFGTNFVKTKNLNKADLIIGNNVLAHVPDINDFVKGLALALKDDGIITMEFPHLLNIIKYNQFDTIYHEHYSYFSLSCVMKIFQAHNLFIYDVDLLSTHGGSMRIYACKNPSMTQSSTIKEILDEEEKWNIVKPEGYINFKKAVYNIKRSFLEFLLSEISLGSKIIAYGAAAKGNTFLNYCNIKKDLIFCVVDKSPYKQGTFLPGSRIPVFDEGIIKKIKPDYVIIFPWNIKEEIMEELSYIREWSGKFVMTIPKLEII